MSNIAALRNVASATRLKEGSFEALMARIEKLKAGLSDLDQTKLDTTIADAFTSVSATLDKIELDQAQAVVNRLQGTGGSQSGSNVCTPSGQTGGFRLPKGDK